MKKNKKERKKRHRAGRQKKDPAFRRRQRGGMNMHINISFQVAGLWACCPIQFGGGLGDSLLTATDRYAYTISVPRMYNIVGREGVKALRSEKWQEAWEAHRQQQPTRATQEKKEKVENWEEAKREFDSVGGTPFHRVSAIAKKHDVAIACLRRYRNCTMKRYHGYGTDSSALVSDSGSDDSWDGDSDATM